MIIIRATNFDDRLNSFGTELSLASGFPVIYLLDERRAIVRADCEKISLTAAACESIGLYCPEDFAWRCGDYGLYLARHQFPKCNFYWQIEYDVRFYGEGLLEFFQKCATDLSDVLAVGYRPAGKDWWWSMFAQARDAQPYRAFFPVVRASSKALDVLFYTRKTQSSRYLRRIQWANDEAFVATTIAKSDLTVSDFNEVWPGIYSESTFNFGSPLEGERLEKTIFQDGLKMFHPVLYGESYTAKVDRLQRQSVQEPFSLRLKRRLLAKLLRFTRW